MNITLINPRCSVTIEVRQDFDDDFVAWWAAPGCEGGEQLHATTADEAIEAVFEDLFACDNIAIEYNYNEEKGEWWFASNSDSEDVEEFVKNFPNF